jgi:hypothetical protein
MRRRGQWSGVPLTLRTAVLDVPLTVDVAEGLNWAEGAEEVVQTQLLRLRCLRRYVRRQGIHRRALCEGEGREARPVGSAVLEGWETVLCEQGERYTASRPGPEASTVLTALPP